MRFDNILLGNILKKRRLQLNISKRKLAQYIEISDTEVTKIENGTRIVPNMVSLIRMCEVLKIDFIELLKVTGFVDYKNLSNRYLDDIDRNKINKNEKSKTKIYSKNNENLKEIEDIFLMEISQPLVILYCFDDDDI